MTSAQPTSPTDRCDLVMKGGIASGIVYPLAVVRLAQTYRFKHIGGTSAGAIAAAATAAAEYGRQRPGREGSGFERLARLPAELGARTQSGQSKLRSLFQPQADVARVFGPLAAALDTGATGQGEDPRRRLRQGLALGRGVLAGYWPWALAGSLPGALLVYETLLNRVLHPVSGSPARAPVPPFATALAGLVGLLAAASGASVAALTAWMNAARTDIPDNLFGLCTGHDERNEPEHLTDWLSRLLDDVSGESVLTFGHLEEADIELRMVTTNLTLGRPVELPFAAPPRLPSEGAQAPEWWFKLSELRALFPKPVVDHLITSASASEQDEFIPLPDTKQLPVIVATRMSLSFPLLLSAVPLHPTDPSKGKGNGKGRPSERPMWFSDGGICSNFPIHFFDSPLPQWPTFGINLRPWQGSRDGEDVVWRPEDEPGRDWDNDARTPWFTFWRSKSEQRSLVGFLGAIRDTTQNWRDSVQLEMPGFRDRVVHVGLADNEGGMNLAMSAPTIEAVAGRGYDAGERLADAFSSPKPDGYWDTHRWVRYRTFLAAAEELLAALYRGYHHLDGDGKKLPRRPFERSYAELAGRTALEPPTTPFAWPGGGAQELLARVEQLIKVADSWGLQPKLGQDVPPVRLRPTPRL